MEVPVEDLGKPDGMEKHIAQLDKVMTKIRHTRLT